MEKWELTKKLTKTDGTIAYIWDGKLHNWDGPALIPEGNMRKREYYLYRTDGQIMRISSLGFADLCISIANQKISSVNPHRLF